jgi:hypothetical protein
MNHDYISQIASADSITVQFVFLSGVGAVIPADYSFWETFSLVSVEEEL